MGKKHSVKRMPTDLSESSTAEVRYTAPTTPTERFFSKVLAEIMGIEQVSVDSHFFDDLGADSMVMARFCARVRKREDLPPVSMKEVYEHPSISRLATALTDTGRAPAPVPESASAPAKAAPVGTSQYLLCGALQFLSALGYSYLMALVSLQCYEWISVGSGFVDIYARSILAGGAVFLGMCILPILAKWMLIGCWKPQQIRIWSLGYFRFWLVKTLVRLNPIVLFAGSPIFIFYLRALGAKIGRGVVILSPQIPVCTDLLTIGDNTVVRKDSFFSCYSAHDGVIHTGPVTIGKDAFVGEMTVLEIGSSLGDGAQLGHSSSLHAGQSVPEGEHRCGSPARQRTEVDYREVDPAECGTSRKIAYSAFVLLNGFVISAFLMSAVSMLRPMIAARPHFAVPGSLAFSHWTFYGDALIISLLLFVGSILFGLLYVVTVPRLLATKVMVPVEGDVREGVGLLGSPSFEIPRSVRRDIELGQPEDGEEQDRKLVAKNKHNLVTVGLFLLAEWILSFLMVLLFLGAVNLYLTVGVSALALALMLALFIRAGYHVLVERASTLFQVLQPQQCSIYDPYFWYHERFWKLTVLPSHLTIFDGTPLKSFAWRLLGVRIGKRVFDDGCDISEKTLVAIGDDCTLNSGSIIQPHSQEDGGFKSDSITIGAGCTLGVNSWVHYGVTMGDGAHLGSHAFLMKGAEVPPHARWWDNPANQVQIDYFAEAAMVAVTPPSPTATNTATSVSGG